MMKFVVRWFLSLIFIVTLLILAAGLAGRLRPTLSLAIFMTNPDGTACDHPCIFGIYPGVTTAEQATALLAEHPLTRDGKWNPKHDLLILPDKITYVTLGITEDHHIVDVISLTDTPFDSGVRIPNALIDTSVLGEFILKFGKPVVGLPGSNYFVIEYPNSGIIAALARPYDYEEFVSPNTPMALLTISNRTSCERAFTLTLHHWMGFKRMQRYFDDYPTAKVDYRFSALSYPPPYLHCDIQPPQQ